MFIALPLEPQVGDIVERYRMDDKFIGAFLVTEAHTPLDKHGNKRKDLIRVTCIFNNDLGSKYSMYKSVKPGDSTWVHRVHLLNRWDAESSNSHQYYKIRNK
jgi:hypothetical protein